MLTQGVPLEKYADLLNNTIKELIRRQTNAKLEYHRLISEFIPIVEKTNETKSYVPLMNMFTNINEWMLTRLEKCTQLTEMIITKKKTAQQILIKEKNLIIEILKLDNLKINALKQEFFTYQGYLRVEWQKDVLEYQLLNQCCLEYQIDYPQLLEAILKITDDSQKIMKYFHSQNKSRGFIYEFYLRYSKKKVIGFEQTLFMADQLKKILTHLDRSNTGQINMLENDHSLENQHYLIELQQVLKFHVQILVEIKSIITKALSAIAYNHKSIQQKYTCFMQIVLELQISTRKQVYHDTLIENISVQLANMVQLSVLRDLSFNIFIVDLSVLVYYKIDNLNSSLNLLLKQSIKTFDSNSKQNKDMQKNGEQKWNDLLLDQTKIREQQLIEYKRILIQRKNHYLGDPNRYCNAQEIQNLSPITLPISVKEFFRLYLSSEEQNFFQQFRTQILKQVQVKFSQFDPVPPQCYLNEECLDLKSLIDSGQASKRVIHYKQPYKSSILSLSSNEYLECKQEEYVYFISDTELMLEQELFIFNQFNSDYFTIRKYMLATETDLNKCELICGFYKHEVKFSLMSFIDFRFPVDEKSIWENQLKDAMLKYADEYILNRDNLREERKQQFILNKNMDFVLSNTSQGFLQEIPILNQMINKNVPEQWNFQSLLKQDTLVKFLLVMILFYYFRGAH